MTRRAVLGSTGAGVLLAITGCNPFSTTATTITVTEQATTTPTAPSPAAPLLGLVFTTRLHVQRLSDAAAIDERDSALLTALLADRKAHLEVLEAEYLRVSDQPLPSVQSSAPTSESDAESTPADPDEVLGQIRGDAATAQTMFTDALAGASRFQAQLYASIAACIATHRMVLS